MHSFLLAAVVAIVAVGPAAAQQLSGTLQKINDSGTIVLGHRDASPPFSFLDEKKQPAGYSVDLCLRIVEAVKTKLGRPDLTVKYVPVSAENRFDKVAEGTTNSARNTTKHAFGWRARGFHFDDFHHRRQSAASGLAQASRASATSAARKSRWSRARQLKPSFATNWQGLIDASVPGQRPRRRHQTLEKGCWMHGVRLR